MIELTKCVIEGHYYKIDEAVNADIKVENYNNDPKIEEAIGWELSRRGIIFYVKCQRCGKRILVNDKGGGL